MINWRLSARLLLLGGGGLGGGGNLGGSSLGGTGSIECLEVLLRGGVLLAVEAGILALTGSHAGSSDGVEILTTDFSGLTNTGDGGLDLLDTAGADGGGDEALNLGSLKAGLLSGLLDLAANDEAADVIRSGQVEELANLVCTLGSQAAGGRDVGDSLNRLLSSLDDGNVQARNVRGQDGSTNALATTLSTATTEGAERVGTTLDQQGDTGRGQNSHNHGESFLVGTTLEAEDVSLELGSKDGTVHIVAEAVLSQVDTAELVIRDLDLLEGTVAGVSDVELHFP
jgi:hypothetical protein